MIGNDAGIATGPAGNESAVGNRVVGDSIPKPNSWQDVGLGQWSFGTSRSAKQEQTAVSRAPLSQINDFARDSRGRGGNRGTSVLITHEMQYHGRRATARYRITQHRPPVLGNNLRRTLSYRLLDL